MRGTLLIGLPLSKVPRKRNRLQGPESHTDVRGPPEGRARGLRCGDYGRVGRESCGGVGRSGSEDLPKAQRRREGGTAEHL